jgi:hypothetical protein
MKDENRKIRSWRWIASYRFLNWSIGIFLPGYIIVRRHYFDTLSDESRELGRIRKQINSEILYFLEKPDEPISFGNFDTSKEIISRLKNLLNQY